MKLSVHFYNKIIRNIGVLSSYILKGILVMICCCYFATAHSSDSLYFNALTVEDGLSNSTVLSVLQDSRGLMWLGTRDGLNRYDGTRIKVYRDFFNQTPSGINTKINCITEDENNDLWIGTSKGLYVYNEHRDSFRLILHGYINTIVKDAEKNLWVGTTSGLYLSRYTPKAIAKLTYMKYSGIDHEIFQNVQSIASTQHGQLVLGTINGLFLLSKKDTTFWVSRPKAMKEVNIMTVCIDAKQNIWVGSNKTGVYKSDSLFNRITHFIAGFAPQNILDNNVRKIFSDKEGNLWIGTLKGLNRYNDKTSGFDFWVHKPEKTYSLNNNSIYNIYEDAQGSLWIGTYYGGANIIEARATQFSVVKNEVNENSLSSNIISAITATGAGNMWIGTEAEGLNYFDLKSRKVTRFNTLNKKLYNSNLVKAVFLDHAHTLWVGLYGGGINYTNNGGRQFLQLTIENSTINSNDVTSIIEDEKQRLWIGQQEQGINIITKDRKQVLRFNEAFPTVNLIDSGITFLYRSVANDIYIGTRSGVFLYSYSNKSKNIEKIFPTSGSSTYVNSIVEDSLHQIWIGSTSGLAMYDAGLKKYVLYTTNNGLPTNRVIGIVPDNADNLWLSTNNGISKFNVQRRLFTNYNKYDGLPSRVFNYNSFFRDKQGRIFFGSLEGLVYFTPSAITVNEVPPHIRLMRLAVNGNKIKVADSTGLLPVSLAETKVMKLQHNQSDLAIDYAVLNFIKPKKNVSAYKLEGFNTDWVYNTEQQAIFTRLQPGTYFLMLKAANNDGIWGSPLQVLKIIVMPPIWETWWAYALYIIIFLLGLRVVLKFYNSKQTLKRELLYEHQMNIQQQELQKMKTDFFTYMSHELRTPLTLISGPAEILFDKEKEGTVERKLVHSIRSNADRMMALTNNLMDFMKADSGALTLHPSVANMVAFAESVFDKFQIQADEKQINYQFYSATNEMNVYFDKHYMEIVFTNLLSNAIKFTSKEGKITMQVNKAEDDSVAISICNNGVGISEKDTEKLFTNFFQALPEIQKQQGFGIGLALCKKLVELHKGRIVLSANGANVDVENQTCFTVYLKNHNQFS